MSLQNAPNVQVHVIWVFVEFRQFRQGFWVNFIFEIVKYRGAAQSARFPEGVVSRQAMVASALDGRGGKIDNRTVEKQHVFLHCFGKEPWKKT